MKKNTSKKKPSVAHEINNVLTTMYMSLELLLRDAKHPLVAQQKKHVKSALADVKRIKPLIKKLGPDA